MKASYICIVVASLFVLPSLSTAQELLLQTIRGTVSNAGNATPLEGATLQLTSQNGEMVAGALTEERGKFTISDVPTGRYDLLVSYVGYEPLKISNLLVVSGKETIQHIELQESPINLPELTVTASSAQESAVNSMATGSVRQLQVETMQRFSGGFADPARMVQNYAGVAGANDDRNDIIVRGNAPSGVGWRLEGVDIPSPNHWASLGTTGGPVSMLNANNLRNSDFHSGAFAAEFGNATAAVFDLNLRNGNSARHEWLGQIGFNGFELGGEGPLSIGQDASFIANVRYSTLGVFSALGINFGTGSAIPVYRDATFKINVPTRKSGIFSLWGLGGGSRISFYNSGANIYTAGSGKINSDSRTGIVGLSHTVFPKKGASSRITLAYAHQANANTSAAYDDSGEEARFIDNYASDQSQDRLTLNWVWNQQINPRNQLKAGTITEVFSLNLSDSIRIDEQLWQTQFHFSGTTLLQRAFVQWKHHFGAHWYAHTGVHATWLGLNNSATLEPRASLNHQKNKHLYTIAVGRHSQMQPLPVYFATDGGVRTNEQLGLIHSHHYTASWRTQLTEDWSLKLETYHQALSGLAVDTLASAFSMINAGASFAFPNKTGLTDSGKGRNTGLEITLEKHFTHNQYLLLTASAFNSQYQGSDGVWRNTYYNTGYIANLLMGKEFTFNSRWALTLDTRVSYAGGRRYTPIDLAASRAAGTEVRDEALAYEEQHAPYFRWDVKIAVRNNHKRYNQLWSLDLVNATNHQNVFTERYNPRSENIQTTWQRGFFPNILYQINF